MLYGKINFLQLLLFLVVVQHSLFAQEFKLSDYLIEGEKDATLSVLTMLQDAAKHKNSKVIIEKGTYNFYPEKAYEQYCFVTNHDNGMRRIAFNIKNFDGLTIDAQGSTFIFHGVMMPFNIENSKNIDISGLNIDWFLPLHSEGLIEANDTTNHSFDLRLADNMPYTIRNEQLIFIKEGFEHDLNQAILFDPERKAVSYNTSKYTPLKMIDHIVIRNKDKFDYHNYIDFRRPEYETQDLEYAIKAKELEPGLVRISGLKGMPPPIGMVLVCKGQFGKARIANAFHINESSNVKLHDLNIYYAGGMGVIGERSQDITLDHVNILPNPEKKLMVSITADAAHFAGCKGKVVIDYCNFRNQLDDGLNVHGAFVIVEDILGPDKVGVRIGHFQQAGFQFAEKGDRVGIIDVDKSPEVAFQTTVNSLNKLNQDYYIITFDENITEKLNKGFILENLDWYPEVTITNSQFADNRARGLLLKSPKKTIIKNNYFSNMMQALIISGGINTWWYESGGAQDLLIEGNTFGDCSYDGRKRPVISIGGDEDYKGRQLGKIIIKNNTFNNFNPSILKAGGVNRLEFINNTINNSKTFPPTDFDAYVIDVKQVDTLNIKNVKISKDFVNKENIKAVKHNLSN
ncbi:alpha-1,3-galactosidase A [Yeosuana aromativorans]|uniref:Alpha-1,3-galactosidase A n=1 Tax=Yeosuana aromativorans TaxID=288019 RepID=A0A8J3FKK4_9FLAO|nr:right-handed parallel beta-helix repeat-containing protein [Yeosuana aromativorans]GGK33796.1 alpha-1,3-galactosidase A [Yeosuana aromativorans]